VIFVVETSEEHNFTTRSIAFTLETMHFGAFSMAKDAAVMSNVQIPLLSAYSSPRIL